MQSISQWTTREVPKLLHLIDHSTSLLKGLIVISKLTAPNLKSKPSHSFIHWIFTKCRASGICGLSPGVEVQTLLLTTSWYWSHHGKQHSQAVEGTSLDSHRRNRARSVSVLGIGSPMASRGNLGSHAGHSWPALSPHGYSTMTPPSPTRGQIQQWGWPGAIWCLSRTQEHKLWGLYFLLSKCSRPKAHSHSQERGLQDCMPKIVFHNTKHLPWTRLL